MSGYGAAAPAAGGNCGGNVCVFLDRPAPPTNKPVDCKMGNAQCVKFTAHFDAHRWTFKNWNTKEIQCPKIKAKY